MPRAEQPRLEVPDVRRAPAGRAARRLLRPPAGRVRHVLMTADAVGGVWRYGVDLAAALGERGVRTTLAVMGPAPGAEACLEAARAGTTVVHRPYRLEWMDDPWDDVCRAGRWLLDLERRLRPDVVHLSGYAHAALSWRAPVVVVAHSCVRTWWRAVKGEAAPARLDAYRDAVAAGLAAARVVVAPSRAMRDALAAEYGLAASMCVIPNGSAGRADTPDEDAKEDLVLAAGRAWDEAKNVAALCAVAGELPWPVYLAGEAAAPGGAALKRLEAVRLLGPLPPAAMAAWYRRAAVYALPARYEPFGLSVLEAARAGCALVLGDIPSLRENWTGAALFVAPDDHRALAAAIRGLVEDPARRRALARRAAARAVRFPIGRTADRYLQVYQGVVA